MISLEVLIYFFVVSLVFRILVVVYSGASAREARQRSTMGKKNW